MTKLHYSLNFVYVIKLGRWWLIRVKIGEFGVCMLLNLTWQNLIWKNIKWRSGKTMGLKVTLQKTKCMILTGNPLGGNLAATFIFYTHMCVFR